MRIAKPMLLITTPVGLAGGIYEAFRLAGGLAFLMIAMLLVIGAAAAMLVTTIRREQQAERLASAHAPTDGPIETCADGSEGTVP